jgi:hypothetical protein
MDSPTNALSKTEPNVWRAALACADALGLRGDYKDQVVMLFADAIRPELRAAYDRGPSLARPVHQTARPSPANPARDVP